MPLCRACKKEEARDPNKIKLRLEPEYDGLCTGCVLAKLTALTDQMKADEDERLRLALEPDDDEAERARKRLAVMVGLCVVDGCDQPPARQGFPWCQKHGEDK